VCVREEDEVGLSHEMSCECVCVHVRECLCECVERERCHMCVVRLGQPPVGVVVDGVAVDVVGEPFHFRFIFCFIWFRH